MQSRVSQYDIRVRTQCAARVLTVSDSYYVTGLSFNNNFSETKNLIIFAYVSYLVFVHPIVFPSVCLLSRFRWHVISVLSVLCIGNTQKIRGRHMRVQPRSREKRMTVWSDLFVYLSALFFGSVEYRGSSRRRYSVDIRYKRDVIFQRLGLGSLFPSVYHRPKYTFVYVQKTFDIS